MCNETAMLVTTKVYTHRTNTEWNAVPQRCLQIGVHFDASAFAFGKVSTTVSLYVDMSVFITLI